MYKIVSDYDIGQEGLEFSSWFEARDWLLKSDAALDLCRDHELEQIDHLYADGYVNIEEVQEISKPTITPIAFKKSTSVKKTTEITIKIEEVERMLREYLKNVDVDFLYSEFIPNIVTPEDPFTGQPSVPILTGFTFKRIEERSEND